MTWTFGSLELVYFSLLPFDRLEEILLAAGEPSYAGVNF
jgi:hypothetical protein